MNQIKLAFAVSAWRNNGKKAPITVRFVQEKQNVSANTHSRLTTRAIGINSLTKQSLLVNFTEDVFNEDFAKFGIQASDITMGYKDENGNIIAKELNISTLDLFGEEIYISRYETTNINEYMNVDEETGEMTVKPGWSEKQVNGEKLTHKGLPIYSTFLFTEDGVDMKLQHDQDLRMSNSKKSESLNQLKESATQVPKTEEVF